MSCSMRTKSSNLDLLEHILAKVDCISTILTVFEPLTIIIADQAFRIDISKDYIKFRSANHCETWFTRI